VHQEGHGIFLIALEIGRLDDVAEDVFIVPTGEGELFVLAELPLRERRLVHVRELPGFAAGESHRIDIGGVPRLLNA